MKVANIVGLLILGGLVSFSCNSGSSSSTASGSSSFPSGFAVASPTSVSSSAGAHVSQSVILPTGLRLLTQPVLDDISGGDFASKKEAFETVTDAATDAACLVSLPPFSPAGSPNCYGPQVDYTNHPDGSPASGQLPGGDVGIWDAAEMDNTACAAAKINNLVKNCGDYADYIMLFSASMVCLATRGAGSLPTTDGGTLDLTSAVQVAMATSNPTVTVSEATITNLTDVTDTDSSTHDVLKYSITTVDGSVTTTAYMTYMLTDRVANTYKGRLWVLRSGISGVNDHAAVSVAFERTTTRLRIDMYSADLSGTPSPDTFNTVGGFKVDGNWTGNLTRGMLEIDPTTGYGNFVCAWQAGRFDSHARIFNGYTDADGGCGFFGFGLNFNTGTGIPSDGVIDGMICNWTGPGNNHTTAIATAASKAQKQCMTINTGTGIFEVDSSRNKIAFAPTNSCNGDGSMTVQAVGAGSPSVATTSNELVDLTTDLDFAAFVLPTAPDMPSSGL